MAAAVVSEGAPRGATRDAVPWRRLWWVPCVLGMLVLAACGKPAVRGRVLPATSERIGLPWRRVEVRLLSGQLVKQLSQLAAQYRRDAVPRARERARASLTAEHTTRADALQQARAALASMHGSGDGAAAAANGGDTTSLQPCFSAAEAQLALARRNYDNLLTSIAPRMAALGVTAHTPAHALPVLQTGVQGKIAGEQRRLRAEYLHSQLVQRSWAVLAPGLGMDHLCWKGENKHDIGLQFRGATVLFNGKPLPDAVARQIWGLPPQDQTLRIPNRHPADRDVLLPGTEFETCFYAREAILSLDTADAYGLLASSPTRGGEWRVQWRDIALVAGAAPGTKSSPAASSTVLFARQLEQFEAGLEETRLIDAMTRSAAARALQQAETALLACHRAMESREAYREVERALHAVEEGRTDELPAQARLRPLVQRDLGEPARLADWIKTAAALLDSGTIARQESELGQSFELAGLAPGQYTLLAESRPAGSKPKLWALPIQVEESVERDLEMGTARDTTLEKMLEDVLLQPQRVPAL